MARKVAKLIACKVGHRLNVGTIIHCFYHTLKVTKVAAKAHREKYRNSTHKRSYGNNCVEDALVKKLRDASVAGER